MSDTSPVDTPHVEMNQINSSHFAERLAAILASERFPLGGRKIVLACPTYGHADPQCQKDIRVAMMTAAAYGCTWVGDASTERMGFSAGRNLAAQDVVNEPSLGDDDGIMWMDSDMRIPPNGIAKLLSAAVDLKLDFITGVYYQRGEPWAPLFFHYNKNKKKFQSYDSIPPNVVAPCDGCGFGFVFTSKRAFKIVANWKGFDKHRGWFPDDSHNGGFSEDLNFCYQAMQAGVQLFVHTGVELGHMGEPEVIKGDRWEKARTKILNRQLFVNKE